MTEFAIHYKEVLFAIDGVASCILGLSLIYLMQTIVPLSKNWPRGLMTALRSGFAIVAIFALWTAGELAIGKFHFVYFGDVVLIVAAAFVTVLVAAFRDTLFGRRPFL